MRLRGTTLPSAKRFLISHISKAKASKTLSRAGAARARHSYPRAGYTRSGTLGSVTSLDTMLAARGATARAALARVSTSSTPRGSGYRASRAHSVTSIARGANARVDTRVGSRRRVVSPPRASDGSDETPATSGSDAGESSSSSASTEKEKKPRKGTGEMLSGLWNELKYVSLRDDPIPEAVDLLATIEASKARPAPGERWDDERWREQEDAAGAVAGKIGAYWSAKWDNLVNSEAVRDAAPLVSSAVNVAIAGVLLRLALPRIAALQAVGGFDELADFFGLPPRAELSGYLDQLRDLNVGVVFAVYVGLFAAEKLTMTDEFLPIGFILPVVSPAVFGGVIGGTVMTSLASTLAASANFWLGRTVLKEKALALKWKDSPAVGETRWFQALSRRFDSAQFPESEAPFTEGFKSALLLRLCPILPIPLSGNWYVCGMTPLRFPEFFAAHFIGSSKTAFVDAYLGSLLLQAAFENDAVREQAKSVLVFETVALVAISIGVTTYATDLFTQILEEEGIDADALVEDAFKAAGDEPDGAAGTRSAGERGAMSTTSTTSTSTTPNGETSNASDAAAKWAAEAFVASATVDESDDDDESAFDRGDEEETRKEKGAWWGTGEDVAGGAVEATDEERALMEAMDAAAAAALSNDEVAKK